MMKRVVLAAMLLALSAAPALAADPILPDATMTPGVVMKSLTTGAAVGTKKICVTGYSSTVRNVPQAVKNQAYKEYGLTPTPGGYEVDHLISLELGGANDIKNLWPQSYHGTWNAHVKDHLENVLHKKVCDKTLAPAKADALLAQVQHEISTDWVKAYKKYVGATPTSGKTGNGG